jgi:voltage-gated potassium channel
MCRNARPCSIFYSHCGDSGWQSSRSGVIPRRRRCRSIVGLLLLTETFFYWTAEDWTLIQSLYFSVVTLTTLGYGDFTPTSDYARIFTIVYIFIGLGVFVAFVSSIAQHYMKQKIDVADRARKQLSAHSHDPPTDRGVSQ